jgi:hypothetical protein
MRQLTGWNRFRYLIGYSYRMRSKLSKILSCLHHNKLIIQHCYFIHYILRPSLPLHSFLLLILTFLPPPGSRVWAAPARKTVKFMRCYLFCLVLWNTALNSPTYLCRQHWIPSRFTTASFSAGYVLTLHHALYVVCLILINFSDYFQMKDNAVWKRPSIIAISTDP